MKPIYLCLTLLLLTMTSAAEMRTWTAQNGKTFEGELVCENGDKVSLKGQNGKTISIPIAGLSQEDQDYIAFNRPLDLDITVEMVKPDQNKFSYLNLKTEVQNRKRGEVDKPLDCYTFVFDDDENLVSSSCSRNLHIHANGTCIQDPDNPATGFNQEDGEEYLVLLVDSADNIVACASNRKKLERDAKLHRQLFMAEKWRSHIPPLLKETSNSGSETMLFRFLDYSITITTNDAGQVSRSQMNFGSAPDQNNEAQKKLITTVDAFAASGFNKAEMPSYYRTTAKLSTVLFPFASINQVQALTLIAPHKKGAYGYHFLPLANRLLSQPRSVRPAPTWFMHTEGRITHDGDITFRFVGQGNGTHIVGLDGKVVLARKKSSLKQFRDNDLPPYILPDILPFPDETPNLYASEWITMEKGESRQLDVVIAPPEKGPFSAMLFVQVQGQEYETNDAGGPILPLFCAGMPPSQDFIDAVYAEVCPKGTKPPEPVVFQILAANAAGIIPPAK